MNSKADHVVMDCVKRELKCLRCGEAHKIALPMSVTDLAKKSKLFTSLHRDCKEVKA